MTVHIIGAGLAGLAAGVRLTQLGKKVVIHEAAGQAGGRCRSFFDTTLDRQVDNGNHLLLSGNIQAMAYLKAIGSIDSFSRPDRASFPFLELENGERWEVKPGRSRMPFWLFRKHLRVPGSTAMDYLAGLKLAWAGENATVRETLDQSRSLYRKFWEPLSVAVLNTAADEAAANLLWPVLKQTFGGGERACRPCTSKRELSDSLIDPAVRFLKGNESQIFFNNRLKTINFKDNRAQSIYFADSEELLAPEDTLILAIPPDVASEFLPGVRFPDQFRAIVNAHFLLPDARHDGHFLGLVGGLSQWLFVRRDVASVTVSAADQLAENQSPYIAATLWSEVTKALNLSDLPLARYRIIKEKRATFAQTPQQVGLRPETKTKWSNVLLAGDWTATGLPATIEGAITSGHRAAETLR